MKTDIIIFAFLLLFSFVSLGVVYFNQPDQTYLIKISKTEYSKMWTGSRWNLERDVCGIHADMVYIGENSVICIKD